jgi:pimeloyl-ACP methyl ester carboxylesterase
MLGPDRHRPVRHRTTNRSRSAPFFSAGECRVQPSSPLRSAAADVDPKTAAFMAESRVPWGVNALGGAVTEPAWKSKPSWYLQVRDDKMIPYPAQQFMAKRAGATVAEVPGSHAIYVSNPSAVAALIEQAAGGVK